jgi:hypothetical protein
MRWLLSMTMYDDDRDERRDQLRETSEICIAKQLKNDSMISSHLFLVGTVHHIKGHFLSRSQHQVVAPLSAQPDYRQPSSNLTTVDV